MTAARQRQTILVHGALGAVGLTRVLSPAGRLVLGFGDPMAMAREPVTAHGFRIRPVAEVQPALTAAGLTLVDHRRVGSGPDAFHLLVAQPATV